MYGEPFVTGPAQVGPGPRVSATRAAARRWAISTHVFLLCFSIGARPGPTRGWTKSLIGCAGACFRPCWLFHVVVSERTRTSANASRMEMVPEFVLPGMVISRGAVGVVGFRTVSGSVALAKGPPWGLGRQKSVQVRAGQMSVGF